MAISTLRRQAIGFAKDEFESSDVMRDSLYKANTYLWRVQIKNNGQKYKKSNLQNLRNAEKMLVKAKRHARSYRSWAKFVERALIRLSEKGSLKNEERWAAGITKSLDIGLSAQIKRIRELYAVVKSDKAPFAAVTLLGTVRKNLNVIETYVVHMNTIARKAYTELTKAI